jgi:rare lipoprotein A
MRRRVAAAAVLLCAVFLSVLSADGAPANGPATYDREGQYIIWKIDGVSVWRFPTSTAADVSELSSRFNGMYSKGFRLADIKVAKVKEKWSLCVGSAVLCSISQEYAKSLKLEPKMAALRLMSRLYEALGEKRAAKLTKEYQLRGKHEISASVSWYGGKFIGRKFANGERYDETDLACAAKSLPFGTLVKITTPKGNSVVVRVTDRFKEHKNRLLDITDGAASILGIKGVGTPKVTIKILGKVDKIGRQ